MSWNLHAASYCPPAPMITWPEILNCRAPASLHPSPISLSPRTCNTTLSPRTCSLSLGSSVCVWSNYSCRIRTYPMNSWWSMYTRPYIPPVHVTCYSFPYFSCFFPTNQLVKSWSRGPRLPNQASRLALSSAPLVPLTILIIIVTGNFEYSQIWLDGRPASWSTAILFVTIFPPCFPSSLPHHVPPTKQGWLNT